MKIIYFDVSAALVLAILLLAVYLKRMTKGDINKNYLLMLLVSFLTTIVDIWAVTLDNNNIGGETQKYLSHALYLILHNSITPLFIIYVTALTDSWMTGKYRILKHAISMVPVLIVYALIGLNAFNHKIFYINEEGHYVRGQWFIVLYVIAFLYVIYGLVKIIRCWSLFDRGRWLSLFSCIGFMMVATAIQFYYPEFLVEMLAGALGLLFLRMMVQRPEEMVDADTGLLSRFVFVPRMNHSHMLGKSRRLVFIILKDYARLHASLGFERETSIIKSIADVLSDYASSMDESVDLYHLRRGRFVAVLKENVDDSLGDIMAKQLHEMFSRSMRVGSFEINMNVAVCVTDFMKDIDDPDDLMRFMEDFQTVHYPDKVLYAKDIYNQSRYDILSDIDAILDNAIHEKRFEVYYQPIYSVDEGCFRTAEALVRLYDEVYGFIPPDLFIPAAERSGAILDIGRIVLDEVCSFIGSEEYRKLGLHYIEVNLSVIQCMEPDLVEQILGTFNKYHIAANEVNLEITETAVSDEREIMDDNINRLFNEGICFSLDDFGTGYSNMHRIASLPLSIIKIDKSMVDDSENITMQIVIENTVKMVKSLGMKIVVEGVETRTQLEHFEDLRCDYIQGYYFSKPLPKNEFVSFIQAKAS